MAKPSSLVIVESPSKAKTIGKYLGPEYTVKASMGHLRDLPKSKMGIDFENGFKPDYRPLTNKKDIIDDLRSTAAKVDAVFLATDPDREGEAISWHLRNCWACRMRRLTVLPLTRSPKRWCGSPSGIPAASTIIW